MKYEFEPDLHLNSTHYKDPTSVAAPNSGEYSRGLAVERWCESGDVSELYSRSGEGDGVTAHFAQCGNESFTTKSGKGGGDRA